jgi:hypothetical protein
MSISNNGSARFLAFARKLLIWIFALYSGGLLFAELAISREFARTFFRDLHGSTPLEGINTILSAFLLWACALLFFICTLALDEADKRLRTRHLAFYWSQVLVIFYLGADDLFIIHERLSRWLGFTERGFPDALIIVPVGILEAVLLLHFRDIWNRPGRARVFLGLGILAYSLTLAIDALVPTGVPLQLSSEDLFKLWGGIFFLLFSLETLYCHLQKLKHLARGDTHPAQ